MVKYSVWNDGFTEFSRRGELTKFTREMNSYGFDEKGIGEELLFPIRLNDKSDGSKETNMATYLIKYKEFVKTYVKIRHIERMDEDSFY